ncbi:MAG: hypothetical protein AUJ92_10900 [Armatimonadetes bacterium CG2_30_59_28]|nr:MAG: hypothetical protein AUJ92_10900 [Armatimonadetes bacterium CG2_30_59_28]PIU67552.1 MAG: hypothetical protein COS85_00175 [Armatimonadetes bacterium CG07_land_8_20_14_0_80_59_28]PIX41823.1 MAG: hypothetical protein COZ56_10890 [Armatimonadetes bacterium CG_4_8_14_3_um_filter_58_9]PIY43052.1 MAG: hypothetical protein COZ05_12255 [Armatimonadetes bacterium CG_4_10_14_3_um_filter_59_10]PJB74370.1 MAG: hypothetical protein CO095_04835 [Armatimonadetes bacterium CG_4_9_14_3_um_filter_58_7]
MNEVPGAQAARRRLVPWQAGCLLVCMGVLLWGAAAAQPCWKLSLALGWIVCYTVNNLYRVWLAWQSVRSSSRRGYRDTQNLPESELPTYTILLPLYQEAQSVPQLVGAVRALDYPVALLQVLCLLRPDDAETRSVLEALELPPHFQLLELPSFLPVGTKPAACNYGLAHATGELLVIYDAEDVPEPEQLRIAATALRHAPPEVACVETPKRVYNGSRNVLTRLYEVEALTWHLLQLPGLVWGESFGPLHGSGAHFRTDTIRKMGGWDYYNVTEDCDLGTRLYRNGYRVELIPSITEEEAPAAFSAWLRQRTRWNKGFLQTLFVHTREPARFIRQLRPRALLAFVVLLPVTQLNLIVGFPTWVGLLLTLALGGWKAPDQSMTQELNAVSAVLLSGLVLAALAVGLSAAGCITARRSALLPYAALMPAYWFLLAFAVYRAAWQFVFDPFSWEKTPHDAHGLK